MKLDINDLLNRIRDIPYILVKIKTPYVPADFPISYAIGKDLDIIVDKEGFKDLSAVIGEFSENYRNKFNIIRRGSGDSLRVRFQNGNILHFQLDVSCGVAGVSDSIVKASIENREQIKNYFVASDKYEIIYRYFFYRKKKKKKYHLRYILEHLGAADRDLLEEAKVSLEGI